MRNNQYMIALFKAWSIFLQEESVGRIYGEYRLKKAIEEARRAFPEAKAEMLGMIEPTDLKLDIFDKISINKARNHE